MSAPWNRKLLHWLYLLCSRDVNKVAVITVTKQTNWICVLQLGHILKFCPC